MIKLSDLLAATLDDKDPLIALQINEAKRLEALDVPRVEAKRKPLKGPEGNPRYIVVDENSLLSSAYYMEHGNAERSAATLTKTTGQPHTACQMMAPESGECPAIPVVTFTPERPHDWIIYRDSKSGEGSYLGLNGVVWFIDHKHYCVRRFATAAEAKTYINKHDIADAYPWPVPKLTTAS